MNTKKIIETAAFSLFKEYPVDTITVQMILDRAEVSRKTFYKYYSDKYELMELFYRRFMDQNILENFNGHNWEEVLSNLHDFIKMDSSYFKHVRDLSGQGSFWEFLRDYSFRFYRSVKLHNEQRDQLTEEERLLIVMLVDGQIALFKQLVYGKANINRESFSDLLCSLLPISYKEILIDDPPYQYTSYSHDITESPTS